jgi:hypothetical protein
LRMSKWRRKLAGRLRRGAIDEKLQGPAPTQARGSE